MILFLLFTKQEISAIFVIFDIVANKIGIRQFLFQFQKLNVFLNIQHIVLFIFHVTKYYDTGTACARIASS